MKGAVEYFILMLVFMMSVLLIIDFASVPVQIQRAHSYRDQVVNLVENYDGDLVGVNERLLESSVCRSCRYVKVSEDSFLLRIEYSIKMRLLGFEKEMSLKGLPNLAQSITY